MTDTTRRSRPEPVYPRVEIDEWGTLFIQVPQAGGRVVLRVGQYTAKWALGPAGFLDIEVKSGLPVSRIRVFNFDGTIVVN